MISNRRSYAPRMQTAIKFICLLLFANPWFGRCLPAAEVRHVVLVSIDGLAARYLDDPRAEMPTIRGLREHGASAAGMLTSFPSVTWPSHTSLITGTRPRTHGVLANTVFDRRTRQPVIYIGDPQLTEPDAVHVPTLYDAAHAAGLKTAAIAWPCTNGTRSLDWTVPDAATSELHERYTTPGLVRELSSAGIDISQFGKWGWKKEYVLRRDHLYPEIANFLLEKKQANLVLVHIITVDGVQHLFGPDTFPARQAVAFADGCVKTIWQCLQKPEFAGNSTLVIVSDHGFAGYDKFIRPNVVLKRLGLVDADAGGNVNGRSAWSVSTGGSAFVYLFDDKAVARTAQIIAALGKVNGVEHVLQAAELVSLGLPNPADNWQMPQLVLTTRPGFSFNDSVLGEPIGDAGGHKGCHGHLPQPSFMHATFVAAGAGIKPGVRFKVIENIDVAPTIARLLHLELPTAEGRVLSEILTDGK
jgi:predicted AlkP superfamily pyrophosphatase or phosphodiesterase